MKRAVLLASVAVLALACGYEQYREQWNAYHDDFARKTGMPLDRFALPTWKAKTLMSEYDALAPNDSRLARVLIANAGITLEFDFDTAAWWTTMPTVAAVDPCADKILLTDPVAIEPLPERLWVRGGSIPSSGSAALSFTIATDNPEPHLCTLALGALNVALALKLRWSEDRTIHNTSFRYEHKLVQKGRTLTVLVDKTYGPPTW